MDYSNQTFTRTSFANSKFRELDMPNIEIEDACLSGAKISDANYDGMTIDGILLNDLFLGHFFRLQAVTYPGPEVLRKHRSAVEALREASGSLENADKVVDYIDRAGEFFCEFVDNAGFRLHCVVPGGAVNCRMTLDENSSPLQVTFK